ncbi:MAG: T9SS type A sorting domain-containing protein, partial [Bacteroidota bacterium]
YTFHWADSVGNGPTVSVSPASTTVYAVVAEDSLGCQSAADSFTVVMDYDQLLVALPDTTVVLGDSLWFCPQVMGGEGPFSFNWSNGSTDSCQWLIPEVNTVLTVTVTDACGNAVADSATVEVDPNTVPLVRATRPGLIAYPNPYSGATTIAVTLHQTGSVQLEVLNLLGARVAVIADGSMPAGRHVFPFAAAAFGQPAGVYLVRLRTDGDERVLRLVETF